MTVCELAGLGLGVGLGEGLNDGLTDGLGEGGGEGDGSGLSSGSSGSGDKNTVGCFGLKAKKSTTPINPINHTTFFTKLRDQDSNLD